MIDSVVLLSGGLDSTVLAVTRKITGERVLGLSVDYGQRHVKELHHAAKIANHLGIEHKVIDFSAMGALLPGSALTSVDVAVPHGRYDDLSMSITVVPNRNAILLMVAGGVADAHGAKVVATAVHAGDHAIYADCRPDFTSAASTTLQLATEGRVSILSPFVHMSKTDIVRLGHEIDAPMHLSWSCYEGGDEHCGQCGTCVERVEAFQESNVRDKTIYQGVS